MFVSNVFQILKNSAADGSQPAQLMVNRTSDRKEARLAAAVDQSRKAPSTEIPVSELALPCDRPPLSIFKVKESLYSLLIGVLAPHCYTISNFFSERIWR